MKFKLWVAVIGAVLAAPFSALAQQSTQPADPADPRAAVPPARYESAITSALLPGPKQNDVTPDKVWRAANDSVAGGPGHAGHGADRSPASSHGHAGHAAPAPSAKPADQPAADHSKHH